MLNKQEMRYALDTVVIDILDDIIAPIIGEPKGILKIDSYHTNLEEFFETPLQCQRAIKKIIEKYQLEKFTQEYIDEDFSFIQLATYVLINGKTNEDYRSLQ